MFNSFFCKKSQSDKDKNNLVRIYSQIFLFHLSYKNSHLNVLNTEAEIGLTAKQIYCDYPNGEK